MRNKHFYITGGDNRVLHTDTSCNGVVLWADAYTKGGDFGGHPYLKLWEWVCDGEDDCLVSTLLPADADTAQRWEDAK